MCEYARAEKSRPEKSKQAGRKLQAGPRRRRLTQSERRGGLRAVESGCPVSGPLLQSSRVTEVQYCDQFTEHNATSSARLVPGSLAPFLSVCQRLTSN